VKDFLQLFHSDEARLYAEIALEDTRRGALRQASTYWVLAYNVEREHRDNATTTRPGGPT